MNFLRNILFFYFVGSLVFFTFKRDLKVDFVFKHVMSCGKIKLQVCNVCALKHKIAGKVECPQLILNVFQHDFVNSQVNLEAKPSY